MPKLHKNWTKTKDTMNIVRWQHEDAKPRAGRLQVTKEEDSLYRVDLLGLNQRRQDILHRFETKKAALNYARTILDVWPDADDYEPQRPDAHDNASFMWVNRRDAYESYLALTSGNAYGYEVFNVSDGRILVSSVHNSDEMAEVLRELDHTMNKLT